MSTLLLERPAADRFALARTADFVPPSQPGSMSGCGCADLREPDVLAAIELPMPISNAFLGEILKPYRPHAKYLKSARITQLRSRSTTGSGKHGGLLTAVGEFSIPESCYIDDTGHFNAVEFNICYNQMAYVTFGSAIETGILSRLRCDAAPGPSFADFKRNQLPAMLIVSIESRYYKPLDGKSFRGELSLERISSVGKAWFLHTTMSFADDQGVKAKGSVMLAYNPAFNTAVE